MVVGCEGDTNVEAFRKHKLLICQADKFNSDGLHAEKTELGDAVFYFTLNDCVHDELV